MGDKARKVSIQLSLDVDKQGAVSQVKAVTEQLKKMLSAFEKSGNSFEVFNDVVGYLGGIEDKVLELKKINALKFDELFGEKGGAALNSAIQNQISGMLEKAKQLPDIISGIQERINKLKNGGSASIKEIRDIGTDIKNLYALMGQTSKIDLDFKGQRGSLDKLDVLSNALNDFQVDWLEFVNTIKDNQNPLNDDNKIAGSGKNPEIEAINKKIEELKAQKQTLTKIFNAINENKLDKQEIEFTFSSEEEMLPKLQELVAEFKKAEEAKVYFEQRKDTSSEEYLEAVKKYIYAAKLLVSARSKVEKDAEGTDAYRYISEGADSDVIEKADVSLKRINDKKDKPVTNIKQQVLDSYKQSIKEIDTEIEKLQNDILDIQNEVVQQDSKSPNLDSKNVDNLTLKYKELKDALLEYKEAAQTINFNDDASDEQINAAFEKQDKLIEKIQSLTNIDSNKLNDILRPFEQDQDANIDTVFQNIISLLETDVPNAVKTTTNTISSTFDKIEDKANQVSESIKKVFESATNIEFDTRNGKANGQESMNLFSSDGGVSTAHGTDYQVDTDSLVQQVIANLNKNIVMSLHNHANGDMAFSPADINSFAKLYYGQGVKINGIIADGIIQTIDFSSIGQDVAINIAKDYQNGIKHLFEAENISQYASITDDGIVPSDLLKQIQVKSTEKYQEIISGLQEAMTIVLRQAFDKNGAEFTLQAFSLDSIEELTTYLTNIQQSADSTLEPVEKLRNLIATLRPDVDLNAFTEIFDKFKNGAIDGTQALNQMLNLKTVSADATDSISDVSAKMEEFLALSKEIQNANLYGAAENNIDIGKYTERLEVAKKELDEFGNQGSLTAEQLAKVQEAFDLATSHLKGEISHYDSFYSGEGGYDYYDEYQEEKSRADALEVTYEQEINGLKQQVTQLESQLAHAQSAQEGALETSSEMQHLEALREKLEIVKQAIISKNKAFNDEGIIVGQTVGKEIAALNNLLDRVKEVSEVLNQLFNNLNSGTDIANGLSNVNINVNGNTDEAASNSYALESTLEKTNTILDAIKSSVDAIGRTTPKNPRPTLEANARIADSKEYEHIKDIALNSIGDKGTNPQITGVKALADGLVQVNGYIKTAEGNYENFVVKVNEANETIGLAFNENQKLTQQMQKEDMRQKAFSNNFNLVADEFVKYKDSIDQSDQVTAKFSNQIQQMENRLATVSNGAELDAWKADWDALTASIAAAKQEQEKLILEAQKRKDTGTLNSIGKSATEIYKSLKIDPTTMTPELEEIRNKYLAIVSVIEEYKKKRESLTQEEINGLKQAEAELQKSAQVYAQKMQAEQKQKEAVQKAYGASQVKNINKKYTQLSGVASGVEFADSASVQAALSSLEAAYDRLTVKQKEFVGIDPTVQQKQEFAQLTDQYNRAYRALDNIIKSSRKLQEQGVGDSYEIVSGTNIADKGIRMQELQNAVNVFSNGTAAVGNFNTECTTLSYTIKNVDGTFTEMRAELDATGTKIVNVAGKVKESTSLFGSMWSAIKGKTKQILTYMVSMGGLSKVMGQIRQGINYVKEIDSALTELKKVTDETDSTYNKFLKTASQAGAEIGTTVSDFTNATADFARLGYTITEATDLAKAANIYKNVGDGINSVSDASESIISTMKAFDIEANDTMGIVDRFNEVGNNFAISSTGIGEALQRSASALYESGNTIDESIALITAANSVVQNPETVGEWLADNKVA